MFEDPITKKEEATSEQLAGSISRLDKQFQQDSDLSSRLQVVIDEVRHLFNFEEGHIFLLEIDGSLNFIKSTFSYNTQYAKFEDPVSRSILSRVIGEREGIVTTNAMFDPRFQESRSIHKMKIRSVICAPVFLGQSIIGALYLESRMNEGMFRKGDLKTIEKFCPYIRRAIVEGAK